MNNSIFPFRQRSDWFVFACALERHQNERQPIILLSDQNAIATINQLAIERDVLNCRVIIARSLGELVAIREEIEPLLIINNSHYLLDDAVNNCITVKTLLLPPVSNK